MNRRVLTVYRRVMDLPEGPTSAEYRRDMRRYVRSLSDEVKEDILSRASELEDGSWDEYEARKNVFLELGFSMVEATFFARCRLNSPGIRTILTQRVAISQYAKPHEIKKINEGDGSILDALKFLYIEGGAD